MLFVNPQAKVNRDIPNIGLAYAATYFKARVIDQNTLAFPKGRFLKNETDILGISVQSRAYSEAVRIAQAYKSRYPGAKVMSVSGFLDIQCCYPYLDFAEKISYDQPFSDSYPFPDYELFDSFALFRKNWQAGAWNYAIMTSQGCPYQCIYCWSRQRKWRGRSAKNCFQELVLAKERWGIKSFAVLDDCFNIDKDRVIEFAKLIKPLGLNWICANGLRADRFDEDMAKAMAESGCRYVSFGIESIVPEILQAIQKGESAEQIESAVDIARAYFSGVNGFFIIGLPKSSYEKDLCSLDWARKKKINAHFSYYVPYEKVPRDDNIFYGEGAHPVSQEYPQELQRKIYQITRGMRPDCRGKNLLNKFIGRIKALKKR
jgi:radical SAM superfamily enzyme YgiQ (UPF0313 family)